MTSPAVEWLRARLESLDRMVLITAVTIRLAGVVLLTYALPLVWQQYEHPAWALLLALGLVAVTAVTVALWLRDRAVRRYPLALDVPAGAAALLLGGWIAPHAAAAGWTFFVLPYTVMISLTLGLACRTAAGAALAGLVWAAACVAVKVWLQDATLGAILLGVVPSYLAYPLIGWLCARLLRRTAAELERARRAATAQGAALAAERERARHARALHDRVLQTLEALARADMVDDPALRDRVQEQAGWLRRYVETGRADQPEDIAAGLVAAARAARRQGLRVSLFDSALRVPGSVPLLPPERRDLLIEVTHQLLGALAGRTGGTVVRVDGQDDGVLVTILADGHSEPPDQQQVAGARLRVTAMGGSLVLEPVPYLELWVPRG